MAVRLQCRALRSILFSKSFTFRQMCEAAHCLEPHPGWQEKPIESSPWLVVGLGIPGEKFSDSRRNVGFEMIDYVAEAEGITLTQFEYKAFVGKGTIGGKTTLLAKPQTGFDLCGEAVRPLSAYYRIPTKNILVVFDDTNLAVGRMKFYTKDGDDDHKGLKNLQYNLKGDGTFPRLGIGVGRPGILDNKNKYALKRIPESERKEIEFCIKHGVHAIRLVITGGVENAMQILELARENTA